MEDLELKSRSLKHSSMLAEGVGSLGAALKVLGRSEAKDRALGGEIWSVLLYPAQPVCPIGGRERLATLKGPSWVGNSCSKPMAEQKSKGSRKGGQ